MDGTNKNSMEFFSNGLISIVDILTSVSESQTKATEYLGVINNNVLSLNTTVTSFTDILSSKLNILKGIDISLKKLLNNFGDNFAIDLNNDISFENPNLNISSSLDSIKSYLENIDKNMTDLTNKYLDKFVEEQLEKDRLDNKIASSQLFDDISRTFEKYLVRGNSTEITQVVSEDKPLQFALEQIQINTLGSLTKLNELTNIVAKIYNHLIGKKTDKDSEPSINKKAKTNSNDFKDLFGSLKSLKDVLDKDFIKNFKDFVKTFDLFLNIDTTKMLRIKVTLLAMVQAFKLIAINTDAVKSSFNSLTVSILFLSLALISPPFLLGAAVLIGILWGIRKALTGTGVLFGWNIKKLATGIFWLVGAIWLLGKLEWDPIFKLITFIGSLAIVIRLVDGKQGYKGGSLFGFAMGISVLTIAMFAMAELPWQSLFKMIIFVGAISLATSLGARIAGGNKMPPLLGFAFGLGLMVIAILAFAEIPPEPVFKILSFILLLGTTIAITNKISGGAFGLKGLAGFAFSLGFLSLVLYVLADLEWYDLLKIISFVTLLGVAVAFAMSVGKKNFSIPGISVNGSSGLIGFSVALLFLGLSLLVFNHVKWESVAKLTAFIFAIGLSLKFYTQKVSSSILMLSFGLLILSGALWVISKTNISLDNALIYAGIITVLSGVLYLLGDKLKQISKGALAITVMSGAYFVSTFLVSTISYLPMNPINVIYFIGTILLLGGVLYLLGSGSIFKKLCIGSLAITVMSGAYLLSATLISTVSNLNIDFINILKFVGAIAILALGVGLLSFLIKFIAIGSGAIAILAVSTLLMAHTMNKINSLKIDFAALGWFMLATIGLAAGFALSSPIFVLGMVASLIMLPLALVALTIATTLLLIRGLTFENVAAFLLAINGLALGFAAMTGYAALSLVGALLMMPLVITALFLAGVFMSISKINITPDKIDNFIISVKALSTMYNDIGLIALTKAAAKSLLMTPLILSALGMALVLKAIDKLDIDKNKILAFGNLTSEFTDIMITALSENEDKFKKAEAGIKSLSKLIGISKGLADVIQLMANMEFYEYTVKDGKPVLKNVRKITTDDMKRVGTNLATMLNCLIEPLLILGENSETIKLGGKTIANPFKNSKSKKGIKMLTNLGNAFKPLVEALSEYSKLAFATDINLAKSTTATLREFINNFGNIFKYMETWKISTAKKSMNCIKDLTNYLSSIEDMETISKFNTIINNFVNTLTDDSKWNKLEQNLIKIKKQFKEIAVSINSIDISKATALERNIKQFVDKNSGENLEETVRQFAELIGLVKEQQEVVNAVVVGETNPTKDTATTLIEKNNSNNKLNQNLNINIETLLTQVQQLLNAINNSITSTNNKLDDTLKVKIVGNNSNSIY